MRRSLRTTIMMTATIGLSLALWTLPAQAQLSISPAYLEVNLEGPRPSGTFQVSNVGTEPISYRINAVHFQFTRDGGLQKIPPNDKSLASWIVFNPKEFTLAPKTMRKIRFVISPQGKPKPGEYWAGIELESLKTTEATATSPNGNTMKVKVITTILVPVFGQVGNVDYTAALKEVQVVPGDGGPVLEAVVANTGSGRVVVEGEYTVLDGTGQVAAKGQCGHAYVMSSTERLFKTTIGDLPPGRYTLQMRYASSRLKTPLEQRVEFEWKPPSAPTAPKTATTAGDLTNEKQ